MGSGVVFAERLFRNLSANTTEIPKDPGARGCIKMLYFHSSLKQVVDILVKVALVLFDRQNVI